MPFVMDNCCGCGVSNTGRRAIVAGKAWHGMFPYDREICTTPAASPDQTKYLQKSVTVAINCSGQTIDDAWDGWVTATANATHCDSVAELHQERAGIASVDRYSGVKTLSSCTEVRTNPSSVTGDGCSQSVNLPFGDIQCISGGVTYYRAWADILANLTACAGVISTTAGMSGCPTGFGGTKAEIETLYNYRTESHETTHFYDNNTNADVTGTADTLYVGTCVVVLTST
jgi:hypothetical protein